MEGGRGGLLERNPILEEGLYVWLIRFINEALSRVVGWGGWASVVWGRVGAWGGV